MKKILVIDDEPDITEVIHLFANRLGYSSDSTHSGDAALEKIKNDRYWAVFCDLKMPGLNGLEIFDKVKELNAELSGRFILLTGAMFDRKMEAKISEKKIKVFRKPFNFEAVMNLFSELEAR